LVGCKRVIDTFGCPELVARVEFGHLRDLCCKLIETWRSRDAENWMVATDIEAIAEAIRYNEKRDSNLPTK